MAAPNIVNVTTITGKTTNLTPANTTPNVLVANSAGSNKVFKVNLIIAANVDGVNAVDATIAINSNAAGSGTSFPIGSTISVPADSSLILIDKTSSFYLEEDRSIVVTSGIASKITYTVSYEEIS